MKTNQQAKKISRGQGEENALYLVNSLEKLTIKQLEVIVTKQVAQSTQNSHFYCTLWVMHSICQADFVWQAEFRA